MKNSVIWGLLIWALCGLVGCKSPVEEAPEQSGQSEPYGYFYLGEEEIPVWSYTTAEEGMFMLKLSPLDEPLKATTYAIVGVQGEFLGEEIDVTTKYHNDDYLFVYEDPTRYYAAYRQPRAGSILLDRDEAGTVTAKVEIVLFDGTPFRYEGTLPHPEEVPVP